MTPRCNGWRVVHHAAAGRAGQAKKERPVGGRPGVPISAETRQGGRGRHPTAAADPLQTGMYHGFGSFRAGINTAPRNISCTQGIPRMNTTVVRGIYADVPSRAAPVRRAASPNARKMAVAAGLVSGLYSGCH